MFKISCKIFTPFQLFIVLEVLTKFLHIFKIWPGLSIYLQTTTYVHIQKIMLTPPLFFLSLRQSITVNCMSKSISNQKKTKTNYRQNASLYISTSKIVFFMLFYFLPVETDLEMESTVVGYRKGSGIGDNLACMEWVNWWVVWSQN